MNANQSNPSDTRSSEYENYPDPLFIVDCAYVVLVTFFLTLNIIQFIIPTVLPAETPTNIILMLIAPFGLTLPQLFPWRARKILIPFGLFSLTSVILILHTLLIKRVTIAWRQVANSAPEEIYFPQAFMFILLIMPFLVFSWMLAVSLKRALFLHSDIGSLFRYIYFILHYDRLEAGDFRKGSNTQSPLRAALWGSVGALFISLLTGLFAAEKNPNLFANWTPGKESKSTFVALISNLFPQDSFELVYFLIPLFAIFLLLVEFIAEYRSWVIELDEEGFNAIKEHFWNTEDSGQALSSEGSGSETFDGQECLADDEVTEPQEGAV